MILAVDTSALLAIFKGEPSARGWMRLLALAGRRGRTVVCDVVAAEVSARFPSEIQFSEALASLGIEFDPIGLAAATLAGRLHAAYRQEGGPRQHLIPDFLIGAHAARQADSLAAIDRGYLRRYFDGLKVIAPKSS